MSTTQEIRTALAAFANGMQPLDATLRSIDRLIALAPESPSLLRAEIERLDQQGRMPAQVIALLEERIARAAAARPSAKASQGDATSPQARPVDPRAQTKLMPGLCPRRSGTPRPRRPEDIAATALTTDRTASLGPQREPERPSTPSQETPAPIRGESPSRAGADESQWTDSAADAHPSGRGSGHATSTAPSQWSATTDTDAHAPMPNEPSVGEVLKDRFELIEVLGRGGMSVVFKALDRRRREAKDRQPYVALKLLNDSFRRHPQSLMALHREAAKAQRLRHPNIIDVYDFDRDEQGRWFISMELLVGTTLNKIIRECRPDGMEPERAWPLIEQIGLGLAAAHGVSPPIVHCDLKPGNVFVTRDGRVKIFDFGIARAVRPMEEDSQEATQFDAGVLKALTPSYASVEMLAGQAPDPRDDVYALAVITYELLSGRRPFGRRGTALQAMATGRHPERIRSLSRRQWQGLASGLALSRDERCPSARQLLDELRPRSHRSTWYLLAAGLGGVAVLAALLFLGLDRLSGTMDTRARTESTADSPPPDPTHGAVADTELTPRDNDAASAPDEAISANDDSVSAVEPSPGLKAPGIEADAIDPVADLVDDIARRLQLAIDADRLDVAGNAIESLERLAPNDVRLVDWRRSVTDAYLVRIDQARTGRRWAEAEAWIGNALEQLSDPESASRLQAARQALRADRTAAEDEAKAAQRDAQTRADALAYWKLIEDADEIAVFEAFLERFDDPVLTILARARLRELKTGRDARPGPAVDQTAAAPTRQSVQPEEPASAAPSAVLARAEEIPPRLIQQALKDLGFYSGIIDGIPGPGTRQAIRRWQRAQGADQTGALTPTEIVNLVRTAAEGGHAESQNTYGMMAARGVGIPANPQLALRWLGAAADQGNAYAAYNLGLIHRDGLGVAPSAELALAEFERARAGGHPEAAKRISELASARGAVADEAGRDSLARVNDLPPQLIQQGLKDLGYYGGVPDGLIGPGTRAAIRAYQSANGLPSTGTLDAAATLALIRAAAAAGHAASRNTLGMMAAQGIGMPRNDAEALRLFELAAADGNAYAAYNLGVMYRDGRAVEASRARALHYFQLARAGGHPQAAAALAELSAGTD